MTTLHEIARTTLAIEKTGRLLETLGIDLADRLERPNHNPFLRWNPTPRLIRNFRLTDVVLDGRFRCLFKGGSLLRDTGYLLSEADMDRFCLNEEDTMGVESDHTILIGCNIAYTNFFHWCTQALPAIDSSIRRVGQSKKVSLALPHLSSFQEESLRLLGIREQCRTTIADMSKNYALPQAEYSEFLNGGAAFSLSQVACDTYSQLRQAIEPLPPLRKKIYVSRADASSRRMRNEEAIIEEVKRRGFHVIEPGSLSFSEQIGTFRSAALVVGPHGAGMTNIAFCEPGTFVYEIIPAHYANACFCNLAYTCRLRYWADAFGSEGTGLPNFREWESDTRLVIKRLDEIEEVSKERDDQFLRWAGSINSSPLIPGVARRALLSRYNR